MRLPGWDSPEPGELWHLNGAADWADAVKRYLPTFNDRPMLRCLEVAAVSAAPRVWSSRPGTWTATIGASIRTSSRRRSPRLPIPHIDCIFSATRELEEQVSDLPENADYIGYMVVRPSALGAVGRTVLRPPPNMATHVRTCVEDRVNLYGRELVAAGVPFVQQDAQFGRCAHAAAWVTHYTAYLRGEVGHRTMAVFSTEADASLALGRPLPSQGLTVQQLSELLRAFDLPPIFYRIGRLPGVPLPWAPPDPTPPPGVPNADGGTWDTRMIPVACRFLNSGLPVMVGTLDHAFVLCGYRREVQPNGDSWIHFIRHDDQLGPYLTVGNVLNDVDPAVPYDYGPWQTLLVPVPEKLWLLAEAAELVGGRLLHALSSALPANTQDPHQPLHDALESGAATLRTYAIEANTFKAQLTACGFDADIAGEYRMARFSCDIWVVEAIDRNLRNLAEPCVLGEAILDATSSDFQPEPLALHVPGVAVLWRTTDVPQRLTATTEPYLSGGIGSP